MDVTSVEFYTLAFVVAMALVALLIGKRDKGTPSTHIVQLLTAAGSEDDEDTLRLERQQGGRVRLTRTGLSLGPEETVNLVFTISDDHCTIVEKKGIKRRGSRGEPVSGLSDPRNICPGNAPLLAVRTSRVLSASAMRLR